MFTPSVSIKTFLIACGFAEPFVSFIICPTKKHKRHFLPACFIVSNHFWIFSNMFWGDCFDSSFITLLYKSFFSAIVAGSKSSFVSRANKSFATREDILFCSQNISTNFAKSSTFRIFLDQVFSQSNL